MSCPTSCEQILASYRAENADLRQQISELRWLLGQERKAGQELAKRVGRLEGETGRRTG